MVDEVEEKSGEREEDISWTQRQNRNVRFSCCVLFRIPSEIEFIRTFDYSERVLSIFSRVFVAVTHTRAREHMNPLEFVLTQKK